MNDYDRIAATIRYLAEQRNRQPDLQELATHAGLSPFHFQRVFTRWAGVTPKEFLQCLTLKYARQALRDGTNVLDSALDVGLSGPGRLHDLCVKLAAASPGEIKTGGAGWKIRAAFADTPFGICLIGESPRGVCHLSFIDSKNKSAGVDAIRNEWPQAKICWDNEVAQLVEQAFVGSTDQPLRLLVSGTQFQIKVWRALLRIPSGSLTTYGRLATTIGDPGAARAVGSAVGKNHLAFLIPCHRVIRQTGVIGDYRWDKERKQMLIAWEATHTKRPAFSGEKLANDQT